MAAGDHFGCPKITFDRISGHFRSIQNYFFFNISNCSHTLLLQSYINVSTKSSRTTKISHIYHFPGKHPHSQYYIRALYLYIETRPSYSKSNAQLPVSPCHRQTLPLVTWQSPVPTSSRCQVLLITDQNPSHT